MSLACRSVIVHYFISDVSEDVLFARKGGRHKKRKKDAEKAPLSFALDEDEGFSHSTLDQPKYSSGDDDLGERGVKRAKLIKNPSVDTSFLPDREREEEERRAREEFRQEWLRKQEEVKAEEIEIVYSYWDGSGHRKSVRVEHMSFSY